MNPLPEPATAKLGWRKGLFRAWIAVSVLWMIGMGGRVGYLLDTGFPTTSEDRWMIPIVLLAPPLLLLALGWTIAWVARGFRTYRL
jgi:hypothetical protein